MVVACVVGLWSGSAQGGENLFVVHRRAGELQIFKQGPGGSLVQAAAPITTTLLSDATGVEVGEFTGDDELDILVTRGPGGIFPSGLSLYRNNGPVGVGGQYTFTEQVITTSLDGYVWGGICGADFNGDGALDALVAGDESLILFLNKAGGVPGQFSSQSFSANWVTGGDGVTGISCEDADNDGDVDVVVGRVNQRYRYVPGLPAPAYLDINNQVNLPQALDAPAGHLNMAIAMGDFTGDNVTDIVGGDHNRLHLLRGTAPGVFSGVTDIVDLGSTAHMGMDAWDVDDDGLLDVIFYIHGGLNLQWLRNLGGGVFGGPQVLTGGIVPDQSGFGAPARFVNPFAPVAGLTLPNALDQNGLLLPQSANLTLQADATNSLPVSGSITSYAFNFGDGTPVVNSATPVPPPHVYAQPGLYRVRVTVTNSLGLTGATSLAVSVQGAAGRPLAALMRRAPGPAVLIYPMKTAPVFTPSVSLFDPQIVIPTTTFTPNLPQLGVAVADFDRDLDSDVLAPVWNGSFTGVYKLTQTAPGVFAPGVQVAQESTGALGPVQDMLVGDFDGDGWIDAALSGGSLDHLMVLINDRSGGFSATLYDPPAGNLIASGKAVADIDLDGNLDVVFYNPNTSDIRWFQGQGDGTFDLPPPATRQLVKNINSTGLAAGDLNGDGKVDLVFDLVVSGQRVIHAAFNDGTGQFNNPVNLGLGLPGGLALGVGLELFDMDTDGRPDLLVGHDGGTFSVYRGLGGASFGPAVSVGTGLGQVGAVGVTGGMVPIASPLPPDLAVSAADIQFTPNNPTPSETVTVCAKVKNLGGFLAGGYQLVFSGGVSGTLTQPAINTGESQTLCLPGAQGPFLSGSYAITVTATALPAGAEPGTLRGNNTAARTLCVGGGCTAPFDLITVELAGPGPPPVVQRSGPGGSASLGSAGQVGLFAWYTVQGRDVPVQGGQFDVRLSGPTLPPGGQLLIPQPTAHTDITGRFTISYSLLLSQSAPLQPGVYSTGRSRGGGYTRFWCPRRWPTSWPMTLPSATPSRAPPTPAPTAWPRCT